MVRLSWDLLESLKISEISPLWLCAGSVEGFVLLGGYLGASWLGETRSVTGTAVCSLRGRPHRQFCFGRQRVAAEAFLCC